MEHIIDWEKLEFCIKNSVPHQCNETTWLNIARLYYGDPSVRQPSFCSNITPTSKLITKRILRALWMQRLIPKIVTHLAVAVSKEVSRKGSCTYGATVLKQNDPKAPTIMKSNEEDCLVDVEPGCEDEQYSLIDDSTTTKMQFTHKGSYLENENSPTTSDKVLRNVPGIEDHIDDVDSKSPNVSLISNKVIPDHCAKILTDSNLVPIFTKTYRKGVIKHKLPPEYKDTR